jgi:hypothetical protein
VDRTIRHLSMVARPEKTYRTPPQALQTRLVFTGLLILTASHVIRAVVWIGDQNLPAMLIAGSLFEHCIARNVGLIR